MCLVTYIQLAVVFLVTIWHVSSGSLEPGLANVHISFMNSSTGLQLQVIQTSTTSVITGEEFSQPVDHDFSDDTDADSYFVPDESDEMDESGQGETGYIQTPGWGYQPVHPQDMDSAVWVEVPEDHRAMVTILHLNLTGTRYLCDTSKVTLVVSETNATNTVWQCGNGRQIIRKYLSKGANLYVHFHSTEAQQKGFKLFFSLHEESALLREESEDAWNCSVPIFADFKPHFFCDLTPQCLDKEDERDCPYFSEECGLGFVTLGKYCLLYEKISKSATWRDNEFECDKRGARLANLRTREDYDKLVAYLEPLIGTWGYTWIAVGLHSPSSFLPMMYDATVEQLECGYRYRQEVQHSDDTLAFYRSTYIKKRVGIFCGFIHFPDGKFSDMSFVKYIALDFCVKEFDSPHVLCEIPQRFDDSTVKIQLPAASNRNHSSLPLIDCLLGYSTRDFLACDFKSACWASDVRSCRAPLTPLPPSFACANGVERVPYTLVCDLRSDCSDDSDENFCTYPSCDLPLPFLCSDQECVPHNTVCDGQKNCHNALDEDLCSASVAGFNGRPSPPAIFHFSLQKGQFVVHELTENQLTKFRPSACPETHFQCPDNGYCMPVYMLCNGVYDCLGREDEADCRSFTCPGFYRCRGSDVCLHPEQLCDDVFQCPQNDDELLCDLGCPETCVCYGLSFFCRQPFLAKNFTKLRFLDGPGSGMSLSDLTENVMLIYLSMAENRLTALGTLTFPNMRILDLSDNQLTEICLRNLGSLPRLETLFLSRNPLSFLFQSTENPDNTSVVLTVTSPGTAEINNVIQSLRTLGLSRVKVEVLNSGFLSQLANLHTLNMSDGGVDTLLGAGIQDLTHLRSLDLRGCPLTNFPRDVFQGLGELNMIHADNYKLCCPATLPSDFVVKNCHAPSDEVSSCDALLRSNSYRVFLSVFASLALIGNSSSFIYRVFIQKKKKLLSFDMFVAHLCVADFLMGIYLSIIGVADRRYLGTYLWEDNSWKSSAVCHMAGFLSLVSSEVSALTICLITIDRFLVICFPFSTFRFGTDSAQVASLCVWALGCLAAAVPLVPSLAHWQFYGQTGICIPLPISKADSPGYSYAFGVMIVANFAFFMVIAAGQFFIYWSVQANTLSSTETTRKTRDLTIARRLITVAMSDFLCWFPIGLVGLMAATGTPVSGEVNVAMVIFVLPFNSALNPFLYTLNIILEKRRNVEEERMKKRLLAQFHSVDTKDKDMA